MVSNVIDIKALLPGSGKTWTITKLFKAANLPNSFLLTPTNKAKQNCIGSLQGLSLSSEESEEALRSVKTLTMFKGNYIKAGEHFYTIESKNHFPKIGAYNIFIDEASMISKAEIVDLINHFPIQNLILDGDTLQFEPIGSKWAMVDSTGKVIFRNDGKELSWEDEGETWTIKDLNAESYHQVVLNKQKRASDEQLLRMIEHIKEGKVLEALIFDAPSPKKCCENLPTDWHIAYTKKRCAKINQMYEKCIPYENQRLIITENDSSNNLWKSQIYHRQDNEIQRAIRNHISSENPISAEEWYRYHTQLAYAVNSHKMQGETCSEGDIFIHLDDLINSLRNVKDEKGNPIPEKEIASTLQKHLYVAVSRATSIKQINIWGLPQVMQDGSYRKVTTIQDKLQNQFFGLYDFLMEKDPERYEELMNEIEDLVNLLSLCEPMVDESILPEAKYAESGEELIEYLEGLLDTRDLVREEWDGYEEWLKAFNTDERVAKIIESNKARKGIKHKQHKLKYTDEYLLTFETKKDLIQVTKNQKVINRWKELTGKSK